MATDSAAYLSELQGLIAENFRLGEIRTLCSELGVDFEGLDGEGKPAKIHGLILALAHRDRLPDLVATMEEKRPLLTWPAVPADFQIPASGQWSIAPDQQRPALDRQTKQEKVLDTAIENEIKVAEASFLLVLIRDPDSKGLRAILDVETDYGLEEEDVRSSRVFQLYYPVDEFGNLLPTLVEIVITAPNFDPPSQSEVIEVDPDVRDDDELVPVEFMLTPLIPGELQLIVEVYQSPADVRKKIGSKPVRTISKDNPSPYARYRVVSLMFDTLSVEGDMVVGDVVHGDKVEGDAIAGDKVGGDKISVGDISGSDIAIGAGASVDVTRGDIFGMPGDLPRAGLNVRSKLQDASQTIGALPQVDQASKDELQGLIEQLEDVLKSAPPQKLEAAEMLSEATKRLIDAAADEPPDQSLIAILGDGLKQAAESLKNELPALIDIMDKIVSAVMAIAGMAT